MRIRRLGVAAGRAVDRAPFSPTGEQEGCHGDRHCAHLGVDWVDLTLCIGHPDNSRFWVHLKWFIRLQFHQASAESLVFSDVRNHQFIICSSQFGREL
jgi:hypothetical protein